MIDKIFSSPTNRILMLGMDAASMRNEVIANNMANSDTPRFKRSEVDFESRLLKALERNPQPKLLTVTHHKHMQLKTENPLDGFKPEVRVISDTSFRNDGNNVDLDVEMANNTKNDLMYDAINRNMTSEIKKLRLAITGRG